MASFFSSTSLFKSPTPRPLCFGEPMLAKLNQAFPAPKELFNKSLLTELLSMHETEFCSSKSIPFCDPGAHTGTMFLLKPKANITMPVEDRGIGARFVTLKKRVHVVNCVCGVDKSTSLTNQEHLQHGWDITFQHPGQLGYHT